MQFSKLLIPLVGICVLYLGYRSFGWAGLAMTSGGIVMWALLHFNKMLFVLKRAASRPIGSTHSAVMISSKLKKGDSLLHVLALTESLGLQESLSNTQPEIFKWCDEYSSSVSCTFDDGKLSSWSLDRTESEVTKLDN
mgnify:CR=1 FL=1